MSKDMQLELARETAVAPVEQSPAASIIAVIARAAADPTVDVEKMKALLDMHERIVAANAKQQFLADLAAIQAVAPRVTRDGKIIVKGQLRSTYATFEAIDEELRPLTAEYGFSYRFGTEETTNKNLKITMTVGHRGGYEEQRSTPLPVDANEYRSAIQNYRSSESFAKRCLVSDYFNIVTVGEDEDGAGGYISLDQQIVINDLLKEVKADMTGFLKFMGCPAVDAIPGAQYQKAINALERKRR